MIIKKIFEEKIDEEVHSDFVKFGKGEFGNKYLLSAKKQKDGWMVKAGSEWVNQIVKKCFEKVRDKPLIKVKGIIVSTLNVSQELGFEIKDVKNFMGIKKLLIDTEVKPLEMIEAIKRFPRVFFAISFSEEGTELKVKEKLPRSPKPSTKGGEEPKAEFCSLKTKDKELIKELFFDCPENFQMVAIKHTIKINEIIYPEGMVKMMPEEIREKAKRRGVLIREIEIDGKKIVNEKEFLA